RVTRRFIHQQPNSSSRVAVSEQAQVSLEIALAVVFGVHQNAMPRARVQHTEQSSFCITAGNRNGGLGTVQSPTPSEPREKTGRRFVINMADRRRKPRLL